MKPIKNTTKETTLESLFPIGCVVKHLASNAHNIIQGYDWCTAICSYCPTKGQHLKLTDFLLGSCPGTKETNSKGIVWYYRRIL